MTLYDKDKYLGKRNGFKRNKGKHVTLSNRAIELLAKQIILSTAPSERLKEIERKDVRSIRWLKREVYELATKIDPNKLTNKQRFKVAKWMDTLGRLPLSEFIEIQSALFEAPTQAHREVIR